MPERNEDSEIFKRLSMHVSLRGGAVHLYAQSVGTNTTDYSTEVGGRVINEFRDEHELSRLYMFSYYATASLFIKEALTELGISSEGIGKEAAWAISWTEIKEQK